VSYHEVPKAAPTPCFTQVQPNTGVFPEGVIVDAKGYLCGTTLSGGKYDFGVAFEITP
jgi:hypothetical protein